MKRPIKQNIIIILFLFVVMFAISIFKTCTGKDRTMELSPEGTLETFYKSLCSGDFGHAGSMCDTLKMEEYIDRFQDAWEANDSTIRIIASDILSGMTVTVTDSEKDGQTRTIFYELSSTDGSGKEKVATLRKEEGEWKIEQITDRY